MNAPLKLDRIDIKMLEELQTDARISYNELARRVGLSPSPCHRRMARIEASGLVRGYVTLLDRNAMGLGLTAFVEVALKDKSPKAMAAFERAVKACPEIMECHIMTGDFDHMLRVASRDIESFRRFIMTELLTMPGVERTNTKISLGEMKYTTALPMSMVRS